MQPGGDVVAQSSPPTGARLWLAWWPAVAVVVVVVPQVVPGGPWPWELAKLWHAIAHGPRATLALER